MQKEIWPSEWLGARVERSPSTVDVSRFIDMDWSTGRWLAVTPFALLSAVYAKLCHLHIARTTQPRYLPSALVLLVSDCRSPTAVALRELTPHRMFFRVKAEDADLSAITPLQADGTYRLAALGFVDKRHVAGVLQQFSGFWGALPPDTSSIEVIRAWAKDQASRVTKDTITSKWSLIRRFFGRVSSWKPPLDADAVIKEQARNALGKLRGCNQLMTDLPRIN
ncbi:hypothetical protein J8273_2192 [Carpediemonas membranifera]|uniref:Uncharacterized protein n=1 Tax=Carpediemonas membranifera TaxID=201153 RepID=A0A8J6BEN0_9EUKA|nr:hypothetical protein J8273_2192 [Carpediemonas membranifera]|eukprot:KAG9395862.1 hypothetical protein J8273_2192 [Carpediemonas membranifera]